MPTRPVRVLVACDHIDYDGAMHGGGRQLIELTRALHASKSVEATVVVLRPATSLGRKLQEEGLRISFLGDNRFNPISLLKLIRIVRQNRIDVMHLTDFSACTWGRLAGAFTRTPSVVQVITHHSPEQPRGFPLPVELAYRLLAPLTSRVLAISSSVKDFAAERMGFRSEDVEVLHYPLPEHSFHEPSTESVSALRTRLGIGPDDPVIGAATRFYGVKGISYLIEAFAIILRTLPNARLLLVGTGPKEGELRARAVSLGVQDRVIFAGFQREVESYVALFDVSAAPSLEEGFGLVALESLRLGVPVVASRVGGLPDIVEDGVSGLLVPPADSPALAAALLRILTDHELRAHMRQVAPGTTARFSLDGYVRRLTQIYRELAELEQVGAAEETMQPV